MDLENTKQHHPVKDKLMYQEGDTKCVMYTPEILNRKPMII